jgi:NAD(P)-dependent dehydrogenase (short-subunit alcohol dehydrogenase family)
MKKTGKGRIVSVSSVAHTWTKNLDLDNLNSEKKWEPKFIYARAKLCNILFMNELTRRLKEAGINGITANSVNPGGVQTAIFRHARKAFKYMIMVSQFFFKVSKSFLSLLGSLCSTQHDIFFWLQSKQLVIMCYFLIS